MASCIYLYNAHRINKYQIQSEAQTLINGFSSELSGLINERLILTKSLAAFVLSRSEKTSSDMTDLLVSEKDFYLYTNSLHNNISDILSIQLAPQGVVTLVTNLDKNQAALGHDLFVDDQRREQVIATIKKEIT